MAKKNREAFRLNNADVKMHRDSTNPFLNGWEPEITYTNKRLDLAKNPAFDGNGNAIEGVILVPRSKDSARFSKIYREYLQELNLLSAPAHNVLNFALYQALPGNGVVYMPTKAGVEFSRFSNPKSFYDGLSELIQRKFLARTEKMHFYYLNQVKVFNGSRRSVRNTFTKPKE